MIHKKLNFNRREEICGYFVSLYYNSLYFLIAITVWVNDSENINLYPTSWNVDKSENGQINFGVNNIEK